jgi:thioredoxin reductase (NADPH)
LTRDPLDLLVVGAGPTGIAIGAEGMRHGLSVLVVDRGGLCEGIRGYPSDMQFFTTRELLEIASVPFAIPDAKPSRVQALAYYREVARHYQLPLALREEVTAVDPVGELFRVRSVGRQGELERRARAVALASGYFGRPLRLGVPGEDLPWVHRRYREPYAHFAERVVVVGGGNSAAEAALELFRWGAQVTVVHRGTGLKPGVKYWLKPDLENRIAAGEVRALFETTVRGFDEDGVRVEGPAGRRVLPAAAAYVLIGYLPELELAERLGVRVDPETLIPSFDADTCESNVPRFYIAGTLQAGRFTHRIFIENSRDHGPRIVAHLQRQLRPRMGTG